MTRPQVADRSAIDPLASEAGSRQPRRHETQAAAVCGRNRTRRNELSSQLQGLVRDLGYVHVLSSSLMDVFARVCASTRFTITAHDSEYFPSGDGRLPGTTTDPAGTRP